MSNVEESPLAVDVLITKAAVDPDFREKLLSERDGAAGYLDGHWGLYGTAEVLPYIILLIILLFKPHGLFGIHEIERV